jgi:NADH-quinone oxidoreductase subunit L
MENNDGHGVHEPCSAVLWPLILLAIPSVILGAILVKPMLYAHDTLLGDTIYVINQYNVLAELAHHFNGFGSAIPTAFMHAPLWFSLAGIFCAWVCYVRYPLLPQKIVTIVPMLYRVLMDKYGFDRLNEKVWQRGTQRLSGFFYRVTDTKILDLTIVDGSGRLVKHMARLLRFVQSGFVYHYAFAMIIGLLAFLVWYVWVV